MPLILERFKEFKKLLFVDLWEKGYTLKREYKLNQAF